MTTTLSVQIPENLQDLFTEEVLQAYGTDETHSDVRQRIQEYTLEDLFPNGVTDRQMAQCCLSGLWLLHNFLDDSHTISQDIHTPEGSYWHAIMHRWEGDFSNSKYWYRNVGTHPVYESVSAEIANDFDPFEFVDDCQRDTRQGGLSDECHKIALTEWKSLFEYCFSNAT